jgi:hypothetical protein
MARRKRPRQKPALHIRQTYLTDEAIAALEGLAADLSELSGRKVSVSGTIRALAAYASERGITWKVTKLLPIVKAQQGQIVWGR